MRTPIAAAVVAVVLWSPMAVRAQAPAGAKAPAAATITKPEHGIALKVPAGWSEVPDPDAALAIARADDADVTVMVFVRREDAPVPVADTLATVLAKMKAGTDQRLLSHKTEPFLGRTALRAELEGAGARYKTVVLPRDRGDRSQIYYVLTAAAPTEVYAKMAAPFDRALAGFQIVDLVAAFTPPPAAPKAAPLPAGFDRAAVIDRALAPQPGPAVPPPVNPAKPTKQEREAADGAAAHARALVFYAQGAYAEAEKDFRTAEKKTDDKVLVYVMAAAYNYVKLHRPDEALKRYQKVYKGDPANTTAMVGVAAAHEEAQNYREAVRMWQRYVKMALPVPAKADAVVLLRTAQDLFAERYEIAENPGGGAPNAATVQQELQWGLNVAQSLASSGVPLVTDRSVTAYVEGLSQALVSRAKNFPTNYQLFVLDSAAVNAFTSPGYIFVYRGILEAADSEAELAGVLAHEIGHSVAHHVAKMQTRLAQDQQQLAEYKQSTSKWGQFMAKMLESGNPYGQLQFSRDNEAQADRLGVHIAFDAGFDPAGLAQMFQRFESMDPSSRKSWDLMMRTHPFSIDRVNAVTEYAALLPPRPTRRTSPEFERLKARLKTLPPPADATGRLVPAPGLPAPAPAPAPAPKSTGPAPAAGGGTPFTLDNAPFAGAIPPGWTARKTEAGTIVFEGAEGTPAYQATVELQVAPKAQLAGLTIDDMAARVKVNLGQHAQARVNPPVADRTADGRPARRVAAAYVLQGEAGRTVPIRHVAGVIDYPDWFVVISYFAPEQVYETFLPEVDFITGQFRHTGR
jgi:predicted Zn-dependent protease